MPRTKTPSFVAEFEVQTTSQDRHVLRSRMEAGRQLYNAILGEALRRLDRMRRDPGLEAAKAMPRGATGEKATPLQKQQAQARKDAFRILRENYGFREFDLHKHPSLAKECWLRGHLDVHAQQKVATRAFKAAERYSYGQGGRPHCKRYGELESVEGKSNEAGIRYRSGHIHWNGEFAKLDLPLIVTPRDQIHAYALAQAESGKVKYVRLLSRTIRGHERVYAQLVLEGEPWAKLDVHGDLKHPIATGVVGGMDLGPSKGALVTVGQVESFAFCAELDRKEKAIRRYQRRVNRQRKAGNPENYNPDGTIRKGRKTWTKSKREQKVEDTLADIHRAMAAFRKSLQGALVHRVLRMGNRWVSEKVSKQAWAKFYGRSIGHKAPGMFETRIETLAEASGGGLELISTYSTFLSSRCLCGKRKKKQRSERKHICGCEFIPEGMYADRDEFSAFLAMFSQGSALDEGRAREAWTQWGADCLLRSSSDCGEVATGEALLPRRAREARQSGSTENGSEQRREAGARKYRTGERRGETRRIASSPLKARQPRSEAEGTHVA
jgi:hypothetical protein